MSSAGGAAFFLVSERQSYELRPGEYVVGRATEADLPFVDDPLASRRHARLVVSADSIEVEDLGSSNGTWVNTELVQHRLRIPAGATLRIGSQVFTVRRAPALPKPRARMDTAPEAPSVRGGSIPDELEGPTQPGDPVSLIHEEAIRALEDRRLDDARKMVEPVLELITSTHLPLARPALERTSILALRLALATGNDAYANWVISTHLERRAPPTDAVAELLATAALDVVDLDLDLLEHYLAMLRRRAPQLDQARILSICTQIEEAAAKRGSTVPSPPPSVT